MANTMTAYRDAAYVERALDISTVLGALGGTYENSHSADLAQDAANLYYRLKGQFVTAFYKRSINQ